MPKVDNLYRAAQAHLADLYSGKVAQERARAQTWAQKQKQMVRDAKQERRKLILRLKEVRDERHGLQAYLDEMLDAHEKWAGGIDECDHAIEGCTNEIIQIQERLAHLGVIING